MIINRFSRSVTVRPLKSGRLASTEKRTVKRVSTVIASVLFRPRPPARRSGEASTAQFGATGKPDQFA